MCNGGDEEGRVVKMLGLRQRGMKASSLLCFFFSFFSPCSVGVEDKLECCSLIVECQ